MRLIKAAKAKGTKALAATKTKIAVVETSTVSLWPSSALPLPSPNVCCDNKRKSKHTAAIAGGVVASKSLSSHSYTIRLKETRHLSFDHNRGSGCGVLSSQAALSESRGLADSSISWDVNSR
ncbi:hypothetical protein BDZ89DRAFT_227058 [Hymenopellis radicata]|nr:hypothetical protein BDZ89DRAFT_227058 [Hymenopellis radicata]